ncbi:hypothetical protein BBP40_002628 [Aspergillus hancockii]|nr:hypothetical protein BBP40_002628 [Aspergillus hancockii]
MGIDAIVVVDGTICPTQSNGSTACPRDLGMRDSTILQIAFCAEPAFIIEDEIVCATTVEPHSV